MGKHISDEKLELLESSYFEDDNEEALSLCDLPVILNKVDDNQPRNEHQVVDEGEEEEFEFGSCGGSLLTDSVMCAADDVFFQGQILPLHFSISSDNGLLGIRPDSRNPSWCESMDHSSSCGFTSVSSRSSSSRSHHSSSTTTTGCKPSRERNQLFTQASPKPQLWDSRSRRGIAGIRSRKSTMWGSFRLGLVRTPQIELQQDAKLRNNKSKNIASSCSNSIDSKICSESDNEVKKQKKKKKVFDRGNGMMMSSCKCSAAAVSAVSSKIVIIKSSNNKRVVKEEKQKQKQLQGKQSMSRSHRRRTFEWLNQLSITGNPTEET